MRASTRYKDEVGLRRPVTKSELASLPDLSKQSRRRESSGTFLETWLGVKHRVGTWK